MKTTFISTFMLADSSRRNILSQSTLVNKLGVELSSGRKFDIGLDLGARTGESVSVRSEFNFLNGIKDTNALAESRLAVSQAAMDDMLTDAQAFMATLVALKEDPTTADIVKADAEGNMGLLVSRLNSQQNGYFIFGGINSANIPFADYSDPTSPNKVAADAAYLAEFGFDQSNPGVPGITAAAMTTYLSGNFDAMFQSPNWEASWSTASDTPLSSRISASETVATSASANETAFRELAKAYTMMSDLGNEALSDDAYKVVVDTAIQTLGSAMNNLTSVMGKMGTVQEQVKLAGERLDVQTNILNTRINDLELVDKEETSVRLTTALTQLETTYAVTSRMQGLSLLNFI
ncbi:flagellar hook-associated family protein [Roseibium alexandrii]|uniref:Flagellin n=1 Tax=Roseibium alexandrii TaxID=388408 RepID=A0A0M7AN20_9HYPH|nr:flagellar hook-associated family protein [Roseibium alexandrii]CTQ75004.1 flagellar hook-associated protein FlgL [Roseibium alexandrii]